MTIKEDKVMYMQHNRERGHGRGGRGFHHNGGHGHGNNNEEMGQMNQQNWHGQGHDRGVGSHNSNVECYNCNKYGHYANDCYAKKTVEENTNLVEEDETKDEGILMMVNEDVTLDSDMI